MMKKNKKTKKLFSSLILLSTIFMSIGYALVSNTSLYITGNVAALEQKDVFITDISCIENTNNSMCTENGIKSANKTLMHSNITLDGDGNSTVTYQITFYNNSNTTYYFDKVTYMEDKNTYSNDNIIFELRDVNNNIIEKGTQLLKNNHITFNIIFKYKDTSNITDRNLNSYLNFQFNPSYIITFNANGGSVDINNKTVIKNELYGELPVPTRIGYIFKGWYTQNDNGSLIKQDTIVDINSDSTIYAQWDCNIIAEEASWFNRSSSLRNNIREIHFIKDYIPTEYTDCWNIDADNTGSLKAYVVNNEILIINLSLDNKVYANNNAAYMFSGHSSYDENNRYFINLTKILGLELLDTSLTTAMNKMFYECSALTEIYLNNFNTSKVTTFSEMFENCRNLRNIDLSSFNTTSAVTLKNMFFNCKKLTSIDVSNFITSNVTEMDNMFRATGIISLNLENFDFSKVKTMEYMFSHNSSITNIQFPTTTFNMTNLTSLYRTFYECSRLENLDLRFITNTTSLTTMHNMFHNCISIQNIKFSDSLNTSNVTDMSSMFSKCASLITLDLSMFDTRNVTTFSYISTLESTDYRIRGLFTGNINLKTIYVSDKFVTTKATDPELGSTNMFLDCKALVGGNGTVYNSEYIDKTYARIDGENGLPGYFTLKS